MQEGLLATSRLDLWDDEGRSLLEQAAGCSDAVACPYRDDRLGFPMNSAALAQVGRHWRWVTQTVSSLRNRYDPWHTCVVATTAPLVWSLTQSEPLPGRWAALYKACVGFSQVFCYLLVHDRAAPIDFFPWLLAEGWLHGADQVCAGSQAQIDQLFACFHSPSLPVFPCDLPTEHVERAGQFLALQAALALATYRSQGPVQEGSLPRRLLRDAVAPWFHSLTRNPGLAPERALALEPHGPGLQRFLAAQSPVQSDEEREALFRTAIC